MKTKRKEIRQQILGVIVLLFMFVMSYGTINIKDLSAATVANTTLIQNLVAGTLSIEAPASLGFNDLTIAVPANSLANLSIVNVRDYRGSGAGWTVTGVTNNLFTSATGINNISNAAIWWTPGARWALDGASNTGVAVGTAGQNFFAPRTLVNAGATFGMGNYKVVNTTINVVYNGRADQLAGTYQATLELTIN